MIERVADLLSDPRLHLDADDIADALWLALQIEAIAPDQGAPEQPAPATDDVATDPEPPPQPPDTQTDTKTTSPQEKESGNLYPSPGQQQGDDPDDMRGVPFRTPAASALPAAREIAKALRPLMRRYPSRTQSIFDEQATVQKIADERIAWIGGRRSRVSGLWHIQLQPARERWFDVELVADVGASMVLWRQSIAEFHHLLLRHGAFRRVRAWSLNTDSEEGSPVLHPGLGDTATRQPPRSRQELLAPGGRRLILVVTDCVSPGWHAGLMTDLLSFWGTHHPIALVQVLPERLWSGSALRAASAIQMQSSGPDTANKRLAYTFQSPMDRLLLRRRAPTHPTTHLPVPVLTLDGDQVAAWASLVTGTGTTPTSGFLLTSTPGAEQNEQVHEEDEQSTDNISPEQLVDDFRPEQLVDDFREYASPEAFRLAQFLAAAPLSLPVIRLVQRTMMPKARQGHIAEVFLSGLLRRRTPAEDDVHPEYVWYDFLAGVREVLRQGLSLYEDALVMERVTEYVREHYGTPQDFQALLFDPDAVDGVALHSDLLPFAEVVAGLQERVGVSTKATPTYIDEQTKTPVTEVAIEPIVIELENERIVIDIENEQVIIDPPRPTPTRDALHQLRPPVADFVNRKPEIQTILAATADAVREGGTSIIGIRGMGGIGKTELALCVANLIRDMFPDAQLVVELFGASNPLMPGRALQNAIRAFEPTAKLPDDLSSLTQLYNACLHGKRALILADDARDAAQVRPLLPPAGCALLITSRNMFTLPGMRRFDLGTLTQADAEKLLLDIAPRIGEHAPALAQLCGYLPLALRVSAELLATDDTRSVSRYLEQLQSDRLRYLRDPDNPDDPTASVEASLSLIYDALPLAAQAVFAQLGVFVGDFTLEAANAVIDIPDTQSLIPDTLGLLRRHSLLDYDPRTERYGLHDLARAFAMARLDDQHPARLRHARYYQSVADRADDLYRKGGDKVLKGLALFDRERRQIDAGWGWAMGQGSGVRDYVSESDTPSPDIDRLLLDFANATVYVGELRYDLRRERIPQLEAQAAAARRLGQRQQEGNALGNLGIAYHNLGEYQRAIAYHEQRLVIAREIGDRRGEGNALGNLGSDYRNLGEYQRAIAYYEQALVISREIGDRRGEGNALGNLGRAYADLGEYARAIDYYEQALVMARAIGDQAGLALHNWNLGLLYEEQGDLTRAEPLVAHAAAFFAQIGHAERSKVTADKLEEVRRTLAEQSGKQHPWWQFWKR